MIKIDKIISVLMIITVMGSGAFFLAVIQFNYVAKNPSWITYFLFALYIAAATTSIITQAVKIIKQ
jgi:hypothetical protein